MKRLKVHTTSDTLDIQLWLIDFSRVGYTKGKIVEWFYVNQDHHPTLVVDIFDDCYGIKVL